MGEYSVVGKSVERTDGRVKVTGRARYAGDLVAPGMLHGKILRSPLPMRGYSISIRAGPGRFLG